MCCGRSIFSEAVMLFPNFCSRAAATRWRSGKSAGGKLKRDLCGTLKRDPLGYGLVERA